MTSLLLATHDTAQLVANNISHAVLDFVRGKNTLFILLSLNRISKLLLFILELLQTRCSGHDTQQERVASIPTFASELCAKKRKDNR